MIEASDSAAAIRNDDTISELFRQGKQTVLPAIINVIEERAEASPEVLQPILDIKDALDSTFELYEQAVSGKVSIPVTTKVQQEENLDEQKDLDEHQDLLSGFDSVADSEGNQPPHAIVPPPSTFRQIDKKGAGSPVPIIPSYEKSTITSGTSNVGPSVHALGGNTQTKKNPDKKEEDTTTTKVHNLLANLESLYASGSSPVPAVAPAPAPASDPLSLSNDYNSFGLNEHPPNVDTFSSFGGSGGGALLDWSQQHQTQAQALQTQDQPQNTQVHQVQAQQPESQLLQQGWQVHPVPQFPKQQPFQEGFEQPNYTQSMSPMKVHNNENTSQPVLGQGGGHLGQQQFASDRQGPLTYSPVEMQQQTMLPHPQLHQSPMRQQTLPPPLYSWQPTQQQHDSQQGYPEQPVQSLQHQHVQKPVVQEPIPQQPGQVRRFKTKSNVSST